MPLLSSPTHTVGTSAQYSASTGLVYVFNVIVGTGALAIPGVVAKAGYLLSSFVLVLLAFISYVTVTFVIEAMAISNAIILTSDVEREEDTEDDPLINSDDSQSQHTQSQQQIIGRASFDINRTIEMGHMARLFFPKVGVYMFYLCLVIYLYGDLAIYVTVVAKSVRDVVCIKNTNTTECLSYFNPELDRLGAYRLFCILFLVVVGPFAFFNVSKTKYLQITTTFFRWTAFSTMIIIAINKITQNATTTPKQMSNITQLPTLFGVSIYSFMCHHSLPSLVTPIKNKRSLHLYFALDYALIATFYILLATTGVFAFENVKDLYTLNFVEDGGFVNYLLALFPVFTLSTNFPIIGITLKNNLRTLFDYQAEFSNVLYTLLAILPPFLVSVFVEDVQFLVNITGSFAGAGIQYVIPCCILYSARNKIGQVSNPYASPFRSGHYLTLVLVWSLLSVVLVVVHLVYN